MRHTYVCFSIENLLSSRHLFKIISNQNFWVSFLFVLAVCSNVVLSCIFVCNGKGMKSRYQGSLFSCHIRKVLSRKRIARCGWGRQLYAVDSVTIVLITPKIIHQHLLSFLFRVGPFISSPHPLSSRCPLASPLPPMNFTELGNGWGSGKNSCT